MSGGGSIRRIARTVARSRHRARERRSPLDSDGIIATTLLVTLGAAACSANSTGSSAAPSTTASTSAGATTTQVPGTGPGVTGTTIKVGIAMINYACIPKAFVDTELEKWGPIIQEANITLQ